jgi:hypothetical protein
MSVRKVIKPVDVKTNEPAKKRPREEAPQTPSPCQDDTVDTSTTPPPTKIQKGSVPLFTFAKSSTSQQPRTEVDERELTDQELKSFQDLGYTGELKAFMSKSDSNYGRWFIGVKRNEFGTWIDAPVPFGYIRKHDGALIQKTELGKKFYKAWAGDPNTEYFKEKDKNEEMVMKYLENLSSFLEEFNIRLTAVEEFHLRL